jgi:uncharacterized membrane protein YczE
MRHVPPPAVRGGVAARLASLGVGLFLVSLGLVLFLEADLGLPPWDVLHQGLAQRTPLTFGAANAVVGVAVLLVAWRLGSRPGLGTLANATLVGAFIELLLQTEAVPVPEALPLRGTYLALGLLAFGAGSALYLGAAMGAGPRDSLMLAVSLRSRTRVGVARTGIELAALASGLALGGSVGVGTAVFALGVGPAVELGFFVLGRSPIAVPGSPPAADAGPSQPPLAEKCW